MGSKLPLKNLEISDIMRRQVLIAIDVVGIDTLMHCI